MRRTLIITLPLLLGIALFVGQGYLHFRSTQPAEEIPVYQEISRPAVKQVHHRAEEGRVAVRNIRRHTKEEMEKLEREGGISEDDLIRAEKELQKLTDRFVAEVDQIQSHKEQELMEV